MSSYKTDEIVFPFREGSGSNQPSAGPQLRPYQQQAVQEFFNSTHNRSLIVCPTGGGKTVIAAHIIQSYKYSIFAAHRKELLDQAHGKLPGSGYIKSGIPYVGGLSAYVASVPTLIRRNVPIPELLVIDEAHRTAAKSYKAMLDMFPGSRLLGLTATPWRLDGKGLAPYFDEIILACTPAELVSQGFLAAPKVYGSSKPPDLSGVRTTAGEYNLKDLMDVVHASTTLTGDVVDHYMKLCPQGRAIVYCVNVAHSKELSTAFNLAGVRAAHVDGNTPAAERDQLIQDFRAGHTRVLTNVAILTEGFDLPELDAVVMARPTKSLTLYLQMVGRVMRPGAAHCLVIDHAGNTSRHGFCLDERPYELLEDPPNKGKRKSDTLTRVCDSCFEVIPVAQRVCNCGHEGWELKQVTSTQQELQELSISCPECGSASVSRSLTNREWLYRCVCLVCTHGWWYTDRSRARQSSDGTQYEEYVRLKRIAQDRGYKPGWVSYRFRALFGKWPPRKWRTHVGETITHRDV